LLAVDPGETSGWAVYANGVLVQWGIVDVHHAPSVAKVISGALQLAEIATLPTVLLLERPYSRRTLGPSRAIWGNAWLDAGASSRRIARAWPSRWRSQLFGRGMGAARQADARAAEQLFANAEISRGKRADSLTATQWPDGQLSLSRQVGGETGVPHDAAAAISMGKWGTRAAEVGKVLPSRSRS
jgi:hypothetical protein